jgi:hypothetical protein
MPDIRSLRSLAIDADRVFSGPLFKTNGQKVLAQDPRASRSTLRNEIQQ